MKNAEYQFSNPNIRKLGYLVWLVLLIFSVIFYKERAVFLDGAFQICKMINEGQFKIYHYRLTNPLTQILALAAIYLKLPLKIVLLAYSINFILLFGLIYHAIVRWCKNDYLGWVLIFFFTLTVLDSFYFLPPELYQGAAFMLLWFALLLRDPLMEKRWTFPILLLLLIPILSDSRLTPVYFLFSAGFFWLKHPTRWNAKFYAVIVFFFICMFIHSSYFVSSYDVGKMNTFHENLEQYKSQLWAIPAHHKFISKCFKIYYCYPILLGIISIGYLIAAFRKSLTINFPILKLLAVLGANAFFILALHIGSPNTTYRFYAEVNYLPLIIMVGIPFVFDFASKVKKENWVLGIFAIIMLIRLTTIANNHQRFEDRHNWYLSQMQKATEQSTNRSAIYTGNTPKHTVIQTWASAHETLLLSSLQGPKHAKTFLVYEDGSLVDKHKMDSTAFIIFDKRIPIEDLNPAYFQLGEGLYWIRK